MSPDVLEAMREFAQRMASRGWWCRSGGAEATDQAFQYGGLLWTPPRFERYLPWHCYNGQQYARLYSPTPAAYKYATKSTRRGSSSTNPNGRSTLATRT